MAYAIPNPRLNNELRTENQAPECIEKYTRGLKISKFYRVTIKMGLGTTVDFGRKSINYKTL